MTTSDKNRIPTTAIRLDLLWLLLGLSAISGAVIFSARGEATPPVVAAMVAAGIVAQSSVLAYLVTVLANSPAGGLAGIGMRTGLPMAAMVFVAEAFPALSAAGFGGYLLMCYLPALALETCLAARRISRSSKSPSQAAESVDSPQAV